MSNINLSWRQRLNGFDWLVLTGLVINMLVISYLVGYWLLN